MLSQETALATWEDPAKKKKVSQDGFPLNTSQTVAELLSKPHSAISQGPGEQAHPVHLPLHRAYL